jgi:glycosyltransferase involved in cell wall biosynthesis
LRIDRLFGSSIASVLIVMNILQVISSSRTSGAEKHLVVLSEWLRKRGHNVTAVCPPGGWLPEQLRDAGIPAIELPMHGSRSSSTILALRKVVREQKVDVIHTHLTRATYMGYFAGNLSHVPVISTVHVLTKDFAYRWLPRRNHWFVAVSDYLRQGLIARGVAESRVHTVYNGTDFVDIADEDRIVPAESLSVRAELGLPADAELVGQIGRVDSFKGAPLLIRAAADVVSRHPRAYFVFVGLAEPGVQQALWELATESRVDDRLRFTGIRNDVPRLMSAMDVITLPSINEACSMAIIEAMTMGKPVVATRAGGNLELVADGETGLLVERNSESVAAAVSEILQDRIRLEQMGRAAKERAHTLFTAQVMAQNMEQVYQRILKTNKRELIKA